MRSAPPVGSRVRVVDGPCRGEVGTVVHVSDEHRGMVAVEFVSRFDDKSRGIEKGETLRAYTHSGYLEYETG